MVHAAFRICPDHAPFLRSGTISASTNVARAAEHRMYATLLAQPPTWARFTLARCALSPTASDGCQQRRVMPTLGRPILHSVIMLSFCTSSAYPCALLKEDLTNMVRIASEYE
jgi:hypothetical protein